MHTQRRFLCKEVKHGDDKFMISCCPFLGTQVSVSDWQWLQNYSLAVKCADALSKRTAFPEQFLSQIADADFNKEDPNPLVSKSFTEIIFS